MSHDEKMGELYDSFLDNLLDLVRTGQVKASDRAVIRQFLRDHNMASKRPQPTTLETLVDQLPHFGEDDDSNKAR